MFTSHIVKFKNEYASAELYLMDDRGRARLRSVYSTKRQRGYATSIMHEVIDYADENALTLYLVVQRYGRPSKALNNDQLVQFYEKFGFKKLKHSGKFIMMFRKSGSQN